jgi:hypothetical protein
MPMTKSLTAGSFDPETTSLLETAFDKTCGATEAKARPHSPDLFVDVPS